MNRRWSSSTFRYSCINIVVYMPKLLLNMLLPWLLLLLLPAEQGSWRVPAAMHQCSWSCEAA
jgi:hypothetical protein